MPTTPAIAMTNGGWADPLSRRDACAFWLRREDIAALFPGAGFTFDLWSEGDERNGARIGMLGRRVST